MDFKSKKVLIPAIIAAVAIGAVIAVPQAMAAAEEQQMSQNMPQINGTINARQAINDYLNENVKVTFAQATDTAQGEVDNGKIVAGHLGVVQGYVVYTFFIVDSDNNGYMTVIDAGNGDVLYTSEGTQVHGMGFGGPMGFGHGYGQWKGHGGFWHGQGW